MYWKVTDNGNPVNVIFARVRANDGDEAIAKVRQQFPKRLANVELVAWALGGVVSNQPPYNNAFAGDATK